MNRQNVVGLCAMVVLSTAISQPQAKADYPFYDPFSVPLGAIGSYSTYCNDSIPYFASHPPVYYSHWVARPYGYSPYASLPGVLPAEVSTPQTPQPLIIQNIYCQPVASSATPTASTTPAPLRIKNPYAAK